MSFTFRLERRPNGALRVRLTVPREQYNRAWTLVGGPRPFRISDDEVQLLIEPSRLVPALENMKSAGDPYAGVAADLASKYRKLAALTHHHVPDVLDDVTLRSLVRQRPAPHDAVYAESLSLTGGFASADVAVLHARAWSSTQVVASHDALDRLPLHMDAHDAVFDQCEVLTTAELVDDVALTIPDSWRLTVAVDASTLEELRPGTLNPTPDPFSRAQLLSPTEAYSLVNRWSLDPSPQRLSAEHLRQTIAAHLSAAEVREQVTLAIRRRTRWVHAEGTALDVSV